MDGERVPEGCSGVEEGALEGGSAAGGQDKVKRASTRGIASSVDEAKVGSEVGGGARGEDAE